MVDKDKLAEEVADVGAGYDGDFDDDGSGFREVVDEIRTILDAYLPDEADTRAEAYAALDKVVDRLVAARRGDKSAITGDYAHDEAMLNHHMRQAAIAEAAQPIEQECGPSYCVDPEEHLQGGVYSCAASIEQEKGDREAKMNRYLDARESGAPFAAPTASPSTEPLCVRQVHDGAQPEPCGKRRANYLHRPHISGHDCFSANHSADEHHEFVPPASPSDTSAGREACGTCPKQHNAATTTPRGCGKCHRGLCCGMLNHSRAEQEKKQP